MYMALYKIDHKSKKWYRRIFFWVLSSCVEQIWILYKRHCERLLVPAKERLDLLSFATSINNVLASCDLEVVGKNRQSEKRRDRPSVGDSIETTDEEAHSRVTRNVAQHP